jgi:hypothetical protein
MTSHTNKQVASLNHPQWLIISTIITYPKHTTSSMQNYINSHPSMYSQSIKNHILDFTSSSLMETILDVDAFHNKKMGTTTPFVTT